MKQTPGQWQVFAEIKAHPTTKAPGTQYVIRATGGRGSNWRVIARTPRHTGEKKAAENEANAQLMAAAPDLLEACKMVLAWAFAPPGSDLDNFTSFAEDIVPLVDEAITKATKVEKPQ